MVLMMTVPFALAVKGPLSDHLQYKFYDGQNALFSALLSGDIDVMAWPLTKAQYSTAITTTNVTVAPYFENGDYEISFNNNATDPSHTADRKACNYTQFRQALACLIDKDGLINGPAVGGFATRMDTSISRPNLEDWVALSVSKYDALGHAINNYPWDYNETHALEILWTNGWYSHTTYPTLASLLATPLPLPANSVVYPPGHPRAGQAIDKLVFYYRTDHGGRKAAGEALVAEMNRLGIPNDPRPGTSALISPAVYDNRDYDVVTNGWSFGTYPTHFYGFYTPAGIYEGGNNFYMIDDANMTEHATKEYPYAESGAMSVTEAKICQEIMVKEAMLCPLYCNAGFMGYKTGAVGMAPVRGFALETSLEYSLLNAKVAPYTSGAMTIKYGTLNPPVSINPIFSSWVWDYEVIDRIFNGPMGTNPYKPFTPLKTPTGGNTPWMAYDWNFQLSTFTGGGGLGNSSITYTNMANVTYWFRHDITWQDGVPFTVDDFNYTIYLNKIYGNSWGQADMAFVVNFVKLDDYTCSVYLAMPSFWALYTAGYNIVPQHIFKYIAVPADAPEGASLTGHNGEWPGKDALAAEILPGAPFTFAQLTGSDGGKYTWVGTGMWKYVPGTYVAGVGGGMVLEPYQGFWMKITQGDIDMMYKWDAGAAPQGGTYSIGLTDLVLLANAYGTSGNGHAVPFKIGGPGVWEPACDLAPPAGTVGLSDLVTLALNYGKNWGGVTKSGSGVP
jgi:ABC-type transport system substrate-binding protein